MTEQDVLNAVEELRKNGWSDDDIVKTFYLMYRDEKIDLDELRGLCKVIGYEFTEEFEHMSDQEKKTKGLRPTNDVDLDEPLSRETFRNGRILKPLIVEAKLNTNEESMYNVHMALRHTMLYVPCRAKLDPIDMDQFLNAKIGDTIKSKGDVRLVPEILDAYDGKFLPVFSDVNDLRKQYEEASVIEEDIVGVIDMFKHMVGVEAICIDPFITPFILDPEGFDYITELPLMFDED